jgi:hypothetical protein
MEVYVAKFDYEKEREDILSFKEGAKFRIASKADKKWWAAYSVETGDYGYVPSSYMERYIDPSEGEFVHSLSESDAGVQKKQALQELKNKVRPTLASESGEGSEDGSSSETEKNEMIIIKPLKSLSVSSNDETELIEPKKLQNPVLASKPHMRLHKELKLNHARGGIQSILGRPELEKVMQRRRPDADGKVGSIRPTDRTTGGGSCVDNELATQFARRSQVVQNEERTSEKQKPEFMTVSLRRTPQIQQ